jgi:hypothetical protein
LGNGTSKQKAKQDSGRQLLQEIRKAAREPDRILGFIERDVLLECCSR